MRGQVFGSLAGLVLLAAGCTPMDAGNETAPPTNGADMSREELAQGAADACGAQAVQDLLGQPISDALAEQAKERAGAERMRQIGPETIVTMDYRTDRLNLYFDEAGTITEIRCG